MVTFDLGSMTFPSAGGRNFLGQGQFSKIVNSKKIGIPNNSECGHTN
jgi:hypothetical protein